MALIPRGCYSRFIHAFLACTAFHHLAAECVVLCILSIHSLRAVFHMRSLNAPYTGLLCLFVHHFASCRPVLEHSCDSLQLPAPLLCQCQAAPSLQSAHPLCSHHCLPRCTRTELHRLSLPPHMGQDGLALSLRRQQSRWTVGRAAWSKRPTD